MATRRAPQVPGATTPTATDADTASEPAVADQAQAAEPAEAEPVAPAGLRASDVDPTKIRRAVLTVDGWVCPAALPGGPVAKE